MKSVICCGGHATRLGELTKITNKHLLGVYDMPMVYYPLLTAQQAGIKEVLIVSGSEHCGHFIEHLGNGKVCKRSEGCLFDLDITYKVQPEAGGIAQAIGLAEQFANGEDILVILGDNIIEGNVIDEVKDFDGGCQCFLKEVHDPERFANPKITNDKIELIEEKPKVPHSMEAIIGIYLFDKQVFEIIKTLKPSKRGELEVTDVLNAYLKSGQLKHKEIKGWWRDVGTVESLLKTSELISQTGACKRSL